LRIRYPQVRGVHLMPEQPHTRRILIMGAAGRDFHNFNIVYRDDPTSRVVAFTATQIPEIAGRRYPPALAGPLYPEGIPIVLESELGSLCRRERIDQVVFAYSDVSHARVMHTASIALGAGSDFLLLGPERTMLAASVPVIAVCAARTGCGKSQTARWLSRILKEQDIRVAVIRHPMPYGDLERQAVQRFDSPADLDAADCTIEEREEYEPHLRWVTSCTPVSTTAKSSPARKQKPISFSGMAVTTIFLSSSRICISCW
jgi:predicted GTPase